MWGSINWRHLKPTYVPTLLSDHCIRSCESLLAVSPLKFSMFTHCRRFSPYVSLWGACTSKSETSSSMYNARNRVKSYDGYKFWEVRKSATAVHLHTQCGGMCIEIGWFDFWFFLELVYKQHPVKWIFFEHTDRYKEGRNMYDNLTLSSYISKTWDYKTHSTMQLGTVSVYRNKSAVRMSCGDLAYVGVHTYVHICSHVSYFALCIALGRKVEEFHKDMSRTLPVVLWGAELGTGSTRH